MEKDQRISMKHCYSLAGQKIIDIKTALEWKGGADWLAAKNLLICQECGHAVILRHGEIRAPHFAHRKKKSTDKECTLRVNSYTPEYIQRRNANSTKYLYGFFQQRFEEYIFIATLKAMKKRNFRLPVLEENEVGDMCITWKTDYKIAEVVSQWILMIKRKPKILKFLFSLGSRTYNDFREYQKQAKKNPPFNDADSYVEFSLKEEFKRFSEHNQDLIQEDPFNSKQLEFSKEVIKQISSTKNSEIWQSLLIAGLNLNLADFEFKARTQMNTELQAREFHYQIHELDDSPGGQPLHLWIAVLAEMMSNEIYKKVREARKSRNKKDEIDLMLWEKNEELAFQVYLRLYITTLAPLATVDVAELARSFYGDNQESEAEIELREIQSHQDQRGFIYIAYSKYWEEEHKIEIQKNEFNGCVKIGYSKDPDRRKFEIAGAGIKPNSIWIVEKYPTTQMKKLESFIHNNLGNYWIYREIFGISEEEALEKVPQLIDLFNKKKITLGKLNSGKGFG